MALCNEVTILKIKFCMSREVWELYKFENGCKICNLLGTARVNSLTRNWSRLRLHLDLDARSRLRENTQYLILNINLVILLAIPITQKDFH